VSEFQARPAQREAIRLLVGVAGGTGSGKTYSALRLASGLTERQPFVLIDTEHGRALQYADEFGFDHVRLEPPFSPSRYLEAVRAQVAAGYGTIVIDSASHEWNGEGGVLDMADAEFERMGSREAVRMAMWIAPKREHKAFVRELVRLPAHVILCLRAEPKVEMRKNAQGRMEVVPKSTLPGGSLDGWIPVCDSMLPFECTCSFLLMADAPGVPRPMKLPGALAPLVPLDSPLAETVGEALAAWAAGSNAPAPADGPEPSPGSPSEPPTPARQEPEHSLSEELDRAFYAVQDRLSIEQILAKFPRVADVQTLPFRWEKVRDALTQEEAEAMLARLSDYREKISTGGR